MIERVTVFIFALFCFLSVPILIAGFTTFFGIPIVLALVLASGGYFMIASMLFYAIFIKKVEIRRGRYKYYNWQDDINKMILRDANDRITNPRYYYLPQNIYYRIYKDK